MWEYPLTWYCCVSIIVHRLTFTSGDKVTCYGKEYLCNTCLSEDPSAAAELQSSDAMTDHDDDDDDMKHGVKYHSVSAPVTPAKKDLSATTTRTAMMTDDDSCLDMSTRSLLDVQTSDSTYTATLLYISIIRPPGTAVPDGLMFCRRCVFYLDSHISEAPRPIGAKLCHMIEIWLE